jgi:predicted Fe-S protein YdhL (DUF1289 family)
MAGIETPCTRVCVVQSALRLCIGCGRTLNEIAHWTAFSDEERSRIMTELTARLVAIRDAAPRCPSP